MSEAGLVDDAEEVAAIAGAIARAPLVAFDLEFLSADRRVPALCLVQVAWQVAPAAPQLEVALIDPLRVDARPVVEALAAHPCAVAHAARQDLQLLATRYGIAITTFADTQVMAAFAGIGDQVGFATLANALLGTSLGKEQQWTDWAARPLSPAQLAYADADVRHLPAIFKALAGRLGGRLAWARAESAVVAADALAAAQVTPETAWQQISGTRGLDGQALAALAALAAWRFRVAIELDRPLGQIASDKVLIELARQRPDAPDGVRAIKGGSPLARQRARDIVAAIAEAAPIALPARAAWRPPSPRAQRWADVLVSIVHVVAEQSGVANRLLATRTDAEEFARVVDERGLPAAESLPALATWRRELLGPPWIGWLTGTVALVGDPHAPTGLTLLPR